MLIYGTESGEKIDIICHNIFTIPKNIPKIKILLINCEHLNIKLVF